MAMSVGLVMPIPAATNAPSPPAMEELLKIGSMSVVVLVFALLEASIPDDLQAVVLLAVVLLGAVHVLGVAMRHRTRTRRPADVEKKAILGDLYQSATKMPLYLSSSSPGSEVNIWLRRPWPVRTHSHAMPQAVGVQLWDHAVTLFSWNTCAYYAVPTY
jgi:hypothetical protein